LLHGRYPLPCSYGPVRLPSGTNYRLFIPRSCFRPRGPPRFLNRSFHARCPLSPRRARRLPLPVTSSPVPGFLYFGSLATRFFCVTRPKRVRLRCGSRVRLARPRQWNYSHSRLLGYLPNGQSTRYPPFRILDRPGLSWRFRRTRRVRVFLFEDFLRRLFNFLSS
jgi:hypothetical protein